MEELDKKVTDPEKVNKFLSQYTEGYKRLCIRIRYNKTVSVRNPGIWILHDFSIDPDEEPCETHRGAPYESTTNIPSCHIFESADGKEILFQSENVEHVKLNNRKEDELVINCFQTEK